jgi:hypothetical protein
VQEVTHGTGAADSASVYLPPMQVYGLFAEPVEPQNPPYSWIAPHHEAPIVQTFSNNVMIIEQDGEIFAIPTIEL